MFYGFDGEVFYFVLCRGAVFLFKGEYDGARARIFGCEVLRVGDFGALSVLFNLHFSQFQAVGKGNAVEQIDLVVHLHFAQVGCSEYGIGCDADIPVSRFASLIFHEEGERSLFAKYGSEVECLAVEGEIDGLHFRVCRRPPCHFLATDKQRVVDLFNFSTTKDVDFTQTHRDGGRTGLYYGWLGRN